MPRALSFVLVHADGTQTALCGLPLIHPTVIQFTAQPGEMQQAEDLASAVHDFLRGLGPHVQECAAPQSVHSQSVQLLVAVGGVRRGLDVSPWTTGGDRHRVLPVFRAGSHPEQILPKPLVKYNAAFWNANPAELATTVLSAAGLTPESHRIFISYRRLETEPLAEDLFESLNRLGFNVFLDRFAVPPAVNFQRRLHHDLAEKAMVLLLESDRFGESQWTMEEITYCKRHELGLYALRMPWGLAKGTKVPTRKLDGIPKEWRQDLTRSQFQAAPKAVIAGGSRYLQWGWLTNTARVRIGEEIRKRHDAAMLRRRHNMRTQMLAELARQQSPQLSYHERADGLLYVRSGRNKRYAVWMTPRPPELPDFHATHASAQFPRGTVGVIVGLKSLLEPEAQRRLMWLSGVTKLVLVDEGLIVPATSQIAEGRL